MNFSYYIGPPAVPLCPQIPSRAFLCHEKCSKRNYSTNIVERSISVWLISGDEAEKTDSYQPRLPVSAHIPVKLIN